MGPAWALVPAKCFDRGKSRLGSVLTDREREAFARGLFDHVLSTLNASGVIDGILVATDCAKVSDAARAHGASVRMDSAPAKLSTIVDAGLADLARRGARSALVLMADLPRLEPDDVRAVVAALKSHDMVIVPDIHGRHTNALALTPPTRLATCFGAAESFADHCASARAAGLRLVTLANERIAFDVDSPADHARL